MSKGKKPKNKPRPPPAPGSRRDTPQDEELDLANLPPLPSSPATSTRPDLGNRKPGQQDPVSDVASQAGDLADDLTGGLQIPGKTQGGDEKEGSLRIKVHLNLHAKVRLELDAQIYGDIVIGLL
ncbi:hypothetical protein N7509_010729 [Penicillium cosmopolitanum]|uniref:Uncharacterized protein n=1 Tax=Penicillium cosmopolitanum TaxID=1131564 RepID=A0A9X0B4U9_9EURO|nr:uncharacterized protein N7509_010729 [Penicillium cosmopolitanum]KAJ5388188.1 hypothetical protein N7509_010729 [Penicillium cosmopolitanum]